MGQYMQFLVIIALQSSEGSGESVQTCQNLCCSHTESMDVYNNDCDLTLDPLNVSMGINGGFWVFVIVPKSHELAFIENDYKNSLFIL